MKIKRYIVNSMQEALYLIKMDLGPDAIIVSSHRVREKGLRGLFTPAKIEVTAAITLDKNEGNRPSEPEQADIISTSRPDGVIAYKIRQSLLKMDIDLEIADFLLQEIDTLKNEKEIEDLLQQRLLSVFKPVPAKKDNASIAAFVGVPGVGKTTTLAKIAANASFFEKSSVAIITIDTFRVGAVEQMKIYGDIIGAPVDVVTNTEEMAWALEKNREKDLILIDTAGRPAKNSYQLSEIKMFLELVKDLDIYLVINATTRVRDVVQILNDFKVIPYNRLIISKLDETETPGTLLNAAYFTRMPIAYITNGQDVPFDIEEANPELLASYIIRDVVY